MALAGGEVRLAGCQVDTEPCILTVIHHLAQTNCHNRSLCPRSLSWQMFHSSYGQHLIRVITWSDVEKSLTMSRSSGGERHTASFQINPLCYHCTTQINFKPRSSESCHWVHHGNWFSASLGLILDPPGAVWGSVPWNLADRRLPPNINRWGCIHLTCTHTCKCNNLFFYNSKPLDKTFGCAVLLTLVHFSHTCKEQQKYAFFLPHSEETSSKLKVKEMVFFLSFFYPSAMHISQVSGVNLWNQDISITYEDHNAP